MDATDNVVDAFEYFMKYKKKHRDYQINPTALIPQVVNYFNLTRFL